MHLRFGKPGIALLLGLLLAAGGRVTMAGDKADHHDHSSSDNGKSDNGEKSESADKPSAPQNKDGDADADDGDETQASQLNSESNAHEADETLEHEQEEVRQAVASGKAAPLTSLLRKLRADYPGQVLDVSLTRHTSRLVFVVKYIDKAGLVKIVSLDALTLKNDW